MNSEDKSFRLRKRISICEAIYANLIIDNLKAQYDKSSWTGFERKIYRQYLKRKEYFMNSISQLLKVGWTLQRLNLTILAIILEAIVEYEVFKTEPAILIHQSLLISKEYGGGEDKLVHAVIDNYLKKKYRQEDKN
ncbi:transcription antitermination factor NusB [Candidatus Mycoplasma haematominutum]|uniref:Transcription antitermination factor NusB n=1 Tax=Candidatus Mycoplasma haematominutum 'Birmingham 1' TaxID=1116213 RepID=G8C2W8_9MOLU|nr:transcription antitermination factor NusB [Candidatus Mycoplasma haematominutum]CCE66666.1 transcription antitermination factor NusB [Candidatus Mycoplasma haematominutum 'Birmingham 1']